MEKDRVEWLEGAKTVLCGRKGWTTALCDKKGRRQCCMVRQDRDSIV